MIEIRTVDELDLRNRRVFYRVDYNVPIEDGRIHDATRIEETLSTLAMMRERDAAVVIASHLGRPRGTRDTKYSLRPILARLSDLLRTEVRWCDEAVGEKAVAASRDLGPGQVLLLENLRFYPGEEANDAKFAGQLAELGDSYVNDAFGACHRAHASIDALPRLKGAGRTAGGLLLARELQFLQKITQVSERPFVTLLGGAKIAGKIEPLEALVDLADTVLIGGGMANTFLASQGVTMGASLVDRESLETARRISSKSHRARIILPLDVISADSIETPTRIETVGLSGGLSDAQRALDIGPQTIAAFAAELRGAKTIFWNGPMGVFEREQFAAGTLAMARAVAEAGAISVVGGGESVEAIKASGYAERISHISTGGGASLEFIAGRQLPGVEVLRKSDGA
jgi:phosphoglycerate kinase